ncbi:hypothetical protein J2X20_004151 [Pelomonas saccharophila]|uniref:Uncharacterized protein n=1 Tax=Roseateles saccharophilus TaxID=304 RepID=A0ABU1YRU6_ROSSA|nr:hypothetical protein [Roseateles saccharophilus]MDR7271483.1 hypothetical protein [Roseateles saccharophilus]
MTTLYEGHVFTPRASGTGPYFGHYRVAVQGSDATASPWVDLAKSWPTQQLACDDATRAARFAIDARNYGSASSRAVEAAARVMMLDGNASGWADAVKAQRAAARERDSLEARLLGAREAHWPDVLVHDDGAGPSRSR